MKRQRHTHATGSLLRPLIAMALSALLAAQWLALLHGAGGHLRTSPTAGVAISAPAGFVGALQAAVSAHDDGSLLCHALEHCLQGGHVGTVAVAVATLPTTPIVVTPVAAAAHGETPAAYLARAPPVLAPLHPA